MEKIQDMQKNKVEDSELDEISGGKLWDLFTAEFKEFTDNNKKKKFALEQDEDHTWGARTLEMRVKAKRKQEVDEAKTIVKL